MQINKVNLFSCPFSLLPNKQYLMLGVDKKGVQCQFNRRESGRLSKYGAELKETSNINQLSHCLDCFLSVEQS